jgi:hypothetical protein
MQRRGERFALLPLRSRLHTCILLVLRVPQQAQRASGPIVDWGRGQSDEKFARLSQTYLAVRVGKGAAADAPAKRRNLRVSVTSTTWPTTSARRTGRPAWLCTPAVEGQHKERHRSGVMLAAGARTLLQPQLRQLLRQQQHVHVKRAAQPPGLHRNTQLAHSLRAQRACELGCSSAGGWAGKQGPRRRRGGALVAACCTAHRVCLRGRPSSPQQHLVPRKHCLHSTAPAAC